MYLKDIESREPGPEAGRFAQGIRAARQAGTPLPQIWYLFAANPAAAKHLCDWVQAVMRGPSPLSPGQRELIAAFTSYRNHCLF
jgi:hypothetical protein